MVSLAQLRALGIGARGVQHRARSGRLRRVHRGIYAVGGAVLPREGRWLAAVLASGDRAVPTLAYPDQVVGESSHRQSAATAVVRDELVRVLNVAAVWKSLAGAVLVLLMAAHLRAWVAGVEND